MKEKICLFAGTTEGRQLAEILHDAAELTVCVATEYGEVLLDGIDGIRIHTGRMDADGMARFFADGRFDRILDATHPYAQAVTDNILSAAARAGVPVMRILRDAERRVEDAVYAASVEEAREYLMGREGNILLTTGAKELSAYVGLDMTRVWARVLPLASSLEACHAAGIQPAHIIAAQGPFTEEINLAQLRMIGARYMVTKASGKNGGFQEKISAARTAGAVPVIIGQPPQGEGYTMDEALRKLALTGNAVRVSVIGIGPGGRKCLTGDAQEALQASDAVIGAKPVADCLRTDKTVYYAFTPEKIREVLDTHPSIRRAAVVMRGDVGFYSGAKKLLDALDGYDAVLIPGISSPVYLAARLGVSWDDAALVSLHGRDCNLLHAIRTNRRVFALVGGAHTAESVFCSLCKYGFGTLTAAVGERLSYPDEKITRGTPETLAGQTFDPLSVVYIENPHACRRLRYGIPDEEFIRGDVPMTKSEVRAVSLSKLALPAGAVVYDIGAGTGSVSVECALAAYEGQVYAVEKDGAAAELIRQNRMRFGCGNLHVVEGAAPDALDGLPVPTHVFIGGSSGNLREILAELLRRNPEVRIVVNTVTLETQAEAIECAKAFRFARFETVSVNIARSRRLGRYNLMTAQNPVCVITLEGGALHD
ncbi:MAG: precorrin-6A reductase [Eubacteriales bacterium]